MWVPNPGTQIYLATCNHRPFDLSFLMRPRIPRALTLHHIHESSPCCCCAALPPADTYKTQRESEPSFLAPNTNLLATHIIRTQKHSTGLLHTSCQHRPFENYDKFINTQDTEFQQLFLCHFWSHSQWRRCSRELSVGILTSSLYPRLDSNPPAN